MFREGWGPPDGPRRGHRGASHHGGGGHSGGRGGGFPSHPAPCPNGDPNHQQRYDRFINNCRSAGITGPRELAEVVSMGGGPHLASEPEIMGPRGWALLRHYRIIPREALEVIRYNYEAASSGMPLRSISGGAMPMRGGSRGGGMGAGMGGMPMRGGSRGGGIRGGPPPGMGGMPMGGGGRGGRSSSRGGGMHGGPPPGMGGMPMGGGHGGHSHGYGSGDDEFDFDSGDDYGEFSGDEDYGHGGHGHGGHGHGGHGHGGGGHGYGGGGHGPFESDEGEPW
ncbi:MAG: hypothetical protein HETSPECPRED_002108 [Heterodermia speciosa]|uniref:Uncharacterized protein n=1 Tax=Heterodermia speciosa TaxID=116794 RepID=A0A8H3PG78_9LECA|nr:MAG: hypothetical protein HETSPECPRED_002108 [Heterodermia speciosa]